MQRYVCVHGHFYQPPRENPWLEAIEQQDSALPYHDWNERITDECYRPNTRSRILDADGWITGFVNNFERISFNFGPTLLSWLEHKAPDVHDAIVEADRRSVPRFDGHGSAIAQTYNHMILPLANERDQRTQVHWGVRDFERRFGRTPEGMWLAETAADTPSLEALAEAGIRFTVLAPRQAKRVRKIGDKRWADCAPYGIDPSRAYLCRLPSGAEIALFFYDGPISQAVAFERLLNDGRHFASRLTDAFSDLREWHQLAHIATDGETYGHHHRHGDMALAVALDHLDSREDLSLTNYAQFLAMHPPEHEVEIHEGSSWSCVHGVERWRSDCGCCSGANPGWNQRWRKPLREALDGLRDAIIPSFEGEAGRFLTDPWAARDDYIELILDRSDTSLDVFFERHAKARLRDADRVMVLRLLEMQRHAMLMYTSCGWFFDEISGIETVQVMLYAARVIQLARLVMNKDLEPEFVARLSEARSNIRTVGTGRDVYDRYVRPAVVDLPKAGAHFAVSSLFSDSQEKKDFYSYTAEALDEHRMTLGRTRLLIGRARLTSNITRASDQLCFAVLHAGDHVINGGSRWGVGKADFDALVAHFVEPFEGGDIAGLIRLMENEFGNSSFSLGVLFHDEQRRVAELISTSAIEQIEGFYTTFHEQFLPLVRFLASIGAPVPTALSLPGQFVFNRAIEEELATEAPNVPHVAELLDTARRESIPLDEPMIAYGLESLLGRITGASMAAPRDAAIVESVIETVELCRRLSAEVDLTPAQILAHALANGADTPDDSAFDALVGRLCDLVHVRRPA